MILLDTMVVSETAKRRPHLPIIHWLERHAKEHAFISAVTLGEIERGIVLKEIDIDYARHLRQWFANLLIVYEHQILPFDVETARTWGRLEAQLRRRSADMMLPAVAKRHGFTIATRNVRHFQGTGVPIVNPWDQA